MVDSWGLSIGFFRSFEFMFRVQNHSGSMLIVEEYEELVSSGLVDPFTPELNIVIV